MLDADLAEIYGYEVKALNQQFATESEMRLVTARVSELSVQMGGITDRQKKTEKDVKKIQSDIDV